MSLFGKNRCRFKGAYRYGGEEFRSAVRPATREAERLAEQIHYGLEALQIPPSGLPGGDVALYRQYRF